MAYDPENNPYIPGDPASYDLKWVIDRLNEHKFAEESAAEAKASAEAAEASAQEASGYADDAEEYRDAASDFADDASGYADNAEGYRDEAADYAAHIADPVSGLVTSWLADNITQPTTPAIDASLSVAGAAADAKAAGDAINMANAGVILSLNNQYEIEILKINSSDTDANVISGTINKYTGASGGSSTVARTQYIKVQPNTQYSVFLNDSSYIFHTAWEYSTDADTGAINNLNDKQGSYSDLHRCFFTTASTAAYVRLAIKSAVPGTTLTADDRAAMKAALHLYIRNDTRSKKIKTGDYEFFTVPVQRPLSFAGEEVNTTTENIECVLRLPNSYSPNGTPTRLIFMAHGAHGYIDSSTQTWYSSSWEELCDDLLAAGYALFDANALSSGSQNPNEIGYACGSPLYVNNIKCAYDYIVENYNVYPQIFAHGTSMGGSGATAFSHAYPQLVLAESSFAGRSLILYLKHIYENTSEDRFAVSYGYSNIALLNSDKFSHAEGASPDLSLIKIGSGIITPPDRNTNYSQWLAYYNEMYSHLRGDTVATYIGHRTVPKKVWNSWADNEMATKFELTLAAAYTIGSACPYYVVNYETGTHNEISFGQINDMRDQLIAWYKRWE